jgi:hypothetical protein
MKLNSNTTPNGKNKIDAQATLNQLSNESWALYCLASLGTKAAFNEVVEAPDLAHLFETIEQRLEALHNTIEELKRSDAVNPVTPTPAGTESQALLTLLLVMLKDWRNLISTAGNRLNSYEFESRLEKAVSLASSVVEAKS